MSNIEIHITINFNKKYRLKYIEQPIRKDIFDIQQNKGSMIKNHAVQR